MKFNDLSLKVFVYEGWVVTSIEDKVNKSGWVTSAHSFQEEASHRSVPQIDGASFLFTIARRLSGKIFNNLADTGMQFPVVPSQNAFDVINDSINKTSPAHEFLKVSACIIYDGVKHDVPLELRPFDNVREEDVPF
jgi:hypothetical protein